jgi:hypothetical protein
VPRPAAGKFIIGEPLASDGLGGFDEPIGILNLTLVKSERLFIQIAEQVKRLNANVCTSDAALQQTPKVLNAVRVNLTVNVLLRVVNHLMNVVGVQTAITLPTIRE